MKRPSSSSSSSSSFVMPILCCIAFFLTLSLLYEGRGMTSTSTMGHKYFQQQIQKQFLNADNNEVEEETWKKRGNQQQQELQQQAKATSNPYVVVTSRSKTSLPVAQRTLRTQQILVQKVRIALLLVLLVP